MLAETADALEALGIVEPFPIQTLTIPVALAGTDVIGQAKTGTGKTLAFGVPVLQHVIVPADRASGDGPEPARRPQALVVVPTRELALQVTNDLQAAGKVRAVRILAVYGGRAYEPQIDALRDGVDVVVGTPGRLLDLHRQHHLDLSGIKSLVLDEADEMLDLGFLPDVERIITVVPRERQTLLFSATMPGQVIALARQYLTRPTHIRAADPHDSGATVAAVKQHVYRAHALDKTEMLARMLKAEGRGLTMVFCRTKRTCAKVAEELTERGFAAAAVHGDLGQGAREQALRAFRNGKIDVLVATDVAARGIDVDGVTHVINYQCPEDEKVYLHRVGRTARAGASGVAVTFVDWDELTRWSLIDTALSLGLAEPPETYSTSEHLYAELGIPAGSDGTLPRSQRTRAGVDAEKLEDVEPPRKRGRERRRRGGTGRTARDGAVKAERPSAAVTAEPAHADAAERPRRTRSRQRTRGGVPIGQAEAAGAVPEAAAAAVASETAPEAGLRRRRRTRRGVAVTDTLEG